MRKTKRTRPEDRPTATVATAVDIARLIRELRRSLEIRQADLAARADVSRQWMVAFEQGKPTLEVGLVLRTLETLGFEFLLRPTDPLPAWIARAKIDAEARRRALACRRRARRTARRREAARERRLWANEPKAPPHLE